MTKQPGFRSTKMHVPANANRRKKFQSTQSQDNELTKIQINAVAGSAFEVAMSLPFIDDICQSQGPLLLLKYANDTTFDDIDAIVPTKIDAHATMLTTVMLK